MSYYYHECLVGTLTIQSEDDCLILVEYGKKQLDDEYAKDDVINKTIKQLDEYFNKERYEFDIKIKFNNVTSFQEKVYQELLNVKYGEVKTYKDIAQAISNPNGSRAVGNANNKNPISIIVPCHRIIGSNNKLVGYGGGIENKEILLRLEGIIL